MMYVLLKADQETASKFGIFRNVQVNKYLSLRYLRFCFARKVLMTLGVA